MNSLCRPSSACRGRTAFIAVACLALAALLAGCASVVDKPVRATRYDFGPVLAVTGGTSATGQPALVLADVEAGGALDGSAVLYRLGYEDANQLRPYAQARWSAPPPQLVRQRLREQLGRDRAVLNLGEGTSLAVGAAPARVLRIELEEFSQFFETPRQSFGLLRLRATLLQDANGGESLVGQRSFVVRQPAHSPDAAGGARALAAATDRAAAEMAAWLAQLNPGR